MRTSLGLRDGTVSEPSASETAWPGAVAARPPARRRRRLPHLLVGVLLVVGCAVAFLVVTMTSSARKPVLVLARPLTVGHVLLAQDLRQVDLPVDVGIRVVDAASAANVVGRVLMTSLPSGALLPPEALTMTPAPVGRGIAALALNPGQLPPEITAGAQVSVVLAPSGSAAAANASAASVAVSVRSWPAVVSSVTASTTSQATVVSVILDESDARDVAALPPGQLALVLLPGGDR